MAALLDAAHAKAVAGGTTKEAVLAAAAAARNIPPHHQEATTGEDAYRWALKATRSAWQPMAAVQCLSDGHVVSIPQSCSREEAEEVAHVDAGDAVHFLRWWWLSPASLVLPHLTAGHAKPC